ncbi:MAG: site-specific integrase [Hyphomicrobiaceae bacterium]|nr:site-specific integrase [Hyphomicrobiaceae bacterium]
MAIRRRTWTWKGEERSAWVCDYLDANGKRHLKTFRTKGEAIDYAAETRIELRQGLHVPDRDSLTVEEAGQQWLTACENDGLEPATLQTYRQHLCLHIAPRIGHKRLRELTVPVLRAFQDQLRADGRSQALTKKTITYLGGLIADAQERGLAVRNPVRERKRKRSRGKAARRHEKRLEVGVDIPTPEEIRAILGAATGYRRAFFMVAAMAGLRASELRGLRWSDVNFPKATITVAQRADKWCVIGSPKAHASQREIRVAHEVVLALKEWKLACPHGKLGLVFPNGRGNVELLANIRRRHWHPLQIAAGVTREEDGETVAKYGGLHALRHFFCSWCANSREQGGLGLTLKETQVRMGHATLSQTADRYGHLFHGDGKREQEVLAAGARALLG